MRDDRFASLSAEELASLVEQGNVDAIHYLRQAAALDRYNREHSVTTYTRRRERIVRARDAESERDAEQAKRQGFATWTCARHAGNDGPKGKEWSEVDHHWAQEPRHWDTWQKKTQRPKGHRRNHVDRHILDGVK